MSNNCQIVAVGSVALDTVTTPKGKKERMLGGSVVYFGTAASVFAHVDIVGIVGEDFPQEHINWLISRNIGLDGLQIVSGKTFHWEGEYHEDNINDAITHRTELNVFESFKPELPALFINPEVLFLANIDPELQYDVLEQVNKPKIVALDTMNFWIETKSDALLKVLEGVDIFLLNDGEAKLLTGKKNTLDAAKEITKMGPEWIVIKRGEFGSLLYGKNMFFAPPFPVKSVCDPTGAGDSFAGGFLGYLARGGKYTATELKRAMFYGAATASFALGGFSIEGFDGLTINKIQERYNTILELTTIPAE